MSWLVQVSCTGCREPATSDGISWLPHSQNSRLRALASAFAAAFCSFGSGLLIQWPVCIAIACMQTSHWIATAQMEKFLRTMKLFGHPQYLICQKGTKEVKGFADFFWEKGWNKQEADRGNHFKKVQSVLSPGIQLCPQWGGRWRHCAERGLQGAAERAYPEASGVRGDLGLQNHAEWVLSICEAVQVPFLWGDSGGKWRGSGVHGGWLWECRSAEGAGHASGQG